MPIIPIPAALEGAAELLTDDQQARLNRQMEAMYGIGEVYNPLQEAKDAGWGEILYRDIPVFREAEMPLTGLYVRLYDLNGRVTACAATKVSRWVNDGYLPALELEVDEDGA